MKSGIFRKPNKWIEINLLLWCFKLAVKILKLDEVEAKTVLGGPVKFIFDRETVDAKHLLFAVGDFNPGEGLKLHLHPESEEVYFILEGSGTVYIGEERKAISVEPNMAIYIPPKTIHGVKNTGSEKLIIAFFVAPGREESKVVE